MKPESKPFVQLTEHDGNAFIIIGGCRKAAKRAGWSDAKWQSVQAEMMSGDYNHLLEVVCKYFEVE